MKKLSVGLATLFGLISAGEAMAQESFHHSTTPPSFEAVPDRPLVVSPSTAQSYAGVGVDLSSDVALDTWTFPLGTSFGVVPDVDVGIDVSLLLKPWAVETSVSQVRLHGRYLVLPDMLALELGLAVPTVFTGMLGFEAITPFRWNAGPIEVFGEGRMAYQGSTMTDILFFGAGATALYSVVDNFFLAADLGFAIVPVRIDLGMGDPTWSTNKILPLGVGAGYRILDGLLAKATFTFGDLATDGGPLDARSFQIVLVQTANLSSDAPIPPPAAQRYETGEETTPVTESSGIEDQF